MEFRTIVQQVEAVEKSTERCFTEIERINENYNLGFITRNELIGQLHEATLSFYTEVNLSESEMSNVEAVMAYKQLKNI